MNGVKAEEKRRGKRRMARYAMALVLIAVVGGIAGAAGVLVPRWIGRRERKLLSGSSLATNITLVCQATHFPDLCRRSLSGDPRSSSGGPSSFLVLISLDQAQSGVSTSLDASRSLLQSPPNGAVAAVAGDCSDVLDMAVSRLAWVTQAWGDVDDDPDFDTILHYLSAVLTWQTDCWNALSKGDVVSALPDPSLVTQANETVAMVSNSLAMTSAFALSGPDPREWEPTGGRKAMEEDGAYPGWMRESDRKLLATAGLGGVVPSVTVSQTGGGQYSQIQAAVDAAPANSQSRWVIYITAGRYVETVTVPSNKINLMFLGDGIGMTVITGSKNVMMPDVTTFSSATMAVNGDGFLGYGFTVENTAGADSHQAVALRLDSDKAAFQNCSFEGFQDTLYTHTLRQFFIDCQIVGSIDFVFGNSATVIQNCSILCRLGNPQVGTCTVTAQGRTDPGQNTGYSIQESLINGTEEYMTAFYANPSANKAYFGRPWKLYSRTVLVNNVVESLIQPQGWLPWNGTFALDTLFYGEYGSCGAGGNVDARVPWSTRLTLSQLEPYTVSNFIQGNQWLPQTFITFSDL